MLPRTSSIWRRDSHPTASGKPGAVHLVAPRLWVRWQLNYLLGAPAILGIAIYFAHYLGFGTLVDV